MTRKAQWGIGLWMCYSQNYAFLLLVIFWRLIFFGVSNWDPNVGNFP